MKSKSVSRLLICLICLGALSLLIWPAPLVSMPLSPRQQVQNAWERALNQDGYRYTSTIIQTVHPTLRLENAGLSSQETRMYMEGEVNRPQELLRLQLWQQGGRVGDADSALEIKIEGGRAYGRGPGSTNWEDLTAHGGSAFTNIFAPGNDPLLYLAAARNIEELGTESVTVGLYTREYTRFAFAVDGARFAEIMRDQVQTRLEREGRWPVGVAMDTARQYVKMQGSGELWINADGRPLRQIVHLHFPPERGAMEWFEVQMTSDFTYTDPYAEPVGGWLIFPARRVLRELRNLVVATVLGSVGLGLWLWLIWNRRSRLVYATVVITVLSSMIVTPQPRSCRATRSTR